MGVAVSNERKPVDRVNGTTTLKTKVIQEGTDASAVVIGIRDVKAQIIVSAGIDQLLMKDRIENEGALKILLLGGADAGKSTILKQMRILHMSGFSEYEIRSFHKYVFQIFHDVAMDVQEKSQDIDESEKNMIYRFAENSSWSSGIEEANENECLLSFLELKCVQSFLSHHSNYSSLPDNALYYLPKLSSILSAEYIPTAEDIIHLRVPTTSVHEINFSFNTATIRLIDVGGQRAYRKKWIHYFEGVSAVMFVASMAAYNQSLEGVDVVAKPVLHTNVFSTANDSTPAKSINRLRESAELFGEMLRSKFLLSSSFILFLNKKDLFTKKLTSHPLNKYLKGYSGHDAEEASEFIKEYFLKRKSRKDKTRTIYSHYTCATDTENVGFVFKAACDIILHQNIENSGMS